MENPLALRSIDILPCIFKFLSSEELFDVSRVCKTWRRVVLSILGRKAHVMINLIDKSNQPTLLDFNCRLHGYMLNLHSFRPTFSIITIDEEDYDEGFFKYISLHLPGSWVLFEGKFRIGQRLSASLFNESCYESINDSADFRLNFNYWESGKCNFDEDFETMYPTNLLLFIQEENASQVSRRPECLDEYFYKTKVLDDNRKQFVKIIVEKSVKFFSSRKSEVSLYATLSIQGNSVSSYLFPLQTSSGGWPNFYLDLLSRKESCHLSLKSSVYKELHGISKKLQNDDADLRGVFVMALIERQYKEVESVYSHWFPSFCSEFLNCFKELFPCIECHLLPVEEIYTLPRNENSVDRCCRSSPIMLTFTYFSRN